MTLRKAFLSPNTVLTFFSADDPAIGVADAEARADVIAKYARTLDQRVLALRPDVEPSKFFVRVLSAEQKAGIHAMLTSDSVDGFTAALSTDVGRGTLVGLVRENLKGYKNFQLVTGFSDNGEPATTRFDCEIGSQPAPEVIEALLSDLGFCVSLMLFLITAGQLSDDEKKA